MTVQQSRPGPLSALRSPNAPVLGPAVLSGRGAQVPEQPSPVFSAMVVAHSPALRESLVAELAVLGADPLHEAGSAGEAVLCARTWGPCELVLVDLDLPDGMALSLLGDLRGRGWQRVVVLAPATDTALVDAAFRLGAHGYLVKAPRGLDGRLHRTRIDSENRLLSRDPVPATLVGADGLLKELSGREVQVLQLVAHGKSNNEVGAELGLSGLTVKSHLSRISRKLGTGDRAQMVALTMRAGIVD